MEPENSNRLSPNNVYVPPKLLGASFGRGTNSTRVGWPFKVEIWREMVDTQGEFYLMIEMKFI